MFPIYIQHIIDLSYIDKLLLFMAHVLRCLINNIRWCIFRSVIHSFMSWSQSIAVYRWWVDCVGRILKIVTLMLLLHTLFRIMHGKQYLTLIILKLLSCSVRRYSTNYDAVETEWHHSKPPISNWSGSNWVRVRFPLDNDHLNWSRHDYSLEIHVRMMEIPFCLIIFHSEVSQNENVECIENPIDDFIPWADVWV